MDFTVYVLKSQKNGKRYVGFTTRTAEERLQDHLKGSCRWTRSNRPFEIIHTEIYETKEKALRREKFLKSGHGREWLDKHVPR